MFHSLTSAGASGKLSDSGKVNEILLAWAYDMAGYAQKMLKGTAYCQTKNIKQFFRVPMFCIDDQQLKEEEL